MTYFEWLSDWPSLFAALSIPVLLLLLVVLAFWSKRLRWRAPFCIIVVYLIVASFVGLFVYQWVPSQYTRDLNWSSPLTDDRSLGLSHGKYLAIAAEQGTSAQSWVVEERADFSRRWLLGPTLAGLAMVVLAILASSLFRLRSFKGSRQTPCAP